MCIRDSYDVVVKVDPTAYSAVNSVARVDISNLAGNLNAVYSEAADGAKEAYSYFGGGIYDANIIQNTTRKKMCIRDSGGCYQNLCSKHLFRNHRRSGV